MTVTEEFLVRGGSERGGWNREQLALLGVKWPPVQGWKGRVLGTFMSDEDARKFLALRGATKKKPRYLGPEPDQPELF